MSAALDVAVDLALIGQPALTEWVMAEHNGKLVLLNICERAGERLHAES